MSNKNQNIINIALLCIASIGVILHFFDKRTCNGQCSKQSEALSINPKVDTSRVTNSTLKIAYFNIDSVNKRVPMIATKSKEFEEKQKQLENNLRNEELRFQTKVMDFQKRVQSGEIKSESEYKTEEAKLAGIQKGVETQHINATQSLVKTHEAFQKKLKVQFNQVLEDINKENHYDYIFSYIEDGILYQPNKTYDITNLVVLKLNKTK